MGVFSIFDFFFGWTKASKCKKLMKKAGCRLNLLKNKRCCIIRQLRNDVAQLIKHGHNHQTAAFNRVEQIYNDERIVVVYDILAHFCEFLSRQLPYIRRHKDFPNDINEAISSIIFASARLVGLPELLRLRKLFTQRYGEPFETTALNLLPGNLVNHQIREILSFDDDKLLTNKAKYKLFKEIITGESLRIEFNSQYNLLQATNDVLDDDHQRPKPVNVDISESQTDFDHHPLMIDHIDAESSSSDDLTDYNVAEDIVYLDDIQEFKSPCNNGKNGTTDQRFFLFKSPDYDILPLLENQKNDQFICFDIKTKRSGELVKCKRETSTPSMKCIDDESEVMRLPVQPHVHPKLPDYDELVAMFMALKKQNLEKHSRFRGNIK